MTRCLLNHHVKLRWEQQEWISNHHKRLSFGDRRDGIRNYLLISVPAKGEEGGIAILWYADHLNVTNMALTHQEVHCMVQVSNGSLAMESISTSIQMLGNRLIRLYEI
ncbi:hypothetical protein P3S68_008396 [Capsicum galapagoense]